MGVYRAYLVSRGVGPRTRWIHPPQAAPKTDLSLTLLPHLFLSVAFLRGRPCGFCSSSETSHPVDLRAPPRSSPAAQPCPMNLFLLCAQHSALGEWQMKQFSSVEPFSSGGCWGQCTGSWVSSYSCICVDKLLKLQMLILNAHCQVASSRVDLPPP